MPQLSFLQNENIDFHSPESILFHLGRIAIRSSLPAAAVRKFLLEQKLSGRILLLSIGKAAEEMGSAAYEIVQSRIFGGMILTKYGHSSGKKFPPLEILEAGHPIPDTNSILGGMKIFELCSRLEPEDTVLILLSGGGSALMEVPAAGLDLEDLIVWNSKLLASGADIRDVNTIRILLSEIKGGGLLSKILPSRSITLILSDVIGDDLSKVASGPTIPATIDKDTIFRIFKQYDLLPNPKIETVLREKTELAAKSVKPDIKTVLLDQSQSAKHGIDSVPQDQTQPVKPPKHEADFGSQEKIDRTKNSVKIDPERNAVYCIGNITLALESVEKECKNLNIPVLFLTSSLNCEAKEAGFFLGSIAKEKIRTTKSPLLILCGGETTVTHDGSGKGGRNQELSLAFAKQISGCKGITLFSLATDGSDGPTDAAGAIVDGTTWGKISETTDADTALKTHRSYEVLKQVDSLVFTGPTGTNVNDIQFLWIAPS
ncbi:MOFRL family protein [Leptospira weilii serovar Ranarum str. ICFT]|uniref:MOFRL family protein n=1 Tax=Leptospira weilii serovar Ranarum str. ICFT TaxID=1218598 RepID=N1WL27_9LEPT|nr:DUF4147 domain-containing protein [Leptospira weilii]EMY79680.1 MOFRL family protein [Leptospira weilii serovar Ranarum str. ICFT]